MSPFDFATILSAGKTLADLKTLIKKLGGQKPDAVAALSMVSQFQQQIDGLRAQVLDLQTENLDLKKTNDELETWKTRTVGIELIQSPGGAYVYARNGKPPYFCPVCFDKRTLPPLQPRASVGDCPSCKACYEIAPFQETSVPVMQRRPPWNYGLHF